MALPSLLNRGAMRWLRRGRRRVGRRASPRGVAAGLPRSVPFDIRAVSLAEGVRAGFAVAAVVALHQWLRWPGLMETALAALLTCLGDVGGPIQRRLPALLIFGAVGAALTALFSALQGASPLLLVPLAGAVVFAASFVRAFGPATMQVGNLLSVVVVLALRQGAPPPSEAVHVGLTFLGGSLWALLLTLIIWRMHPYRPAREAVAACIRDMAAMANDMRLVAEQPHPDAWDLHARAHRRAVRDALEGARVAVLATVRARGPASGPAAQSWLRLEAADQLFGALIAFSDLLARGLPDPERDRADRVLRLVVGALHVLEHEIVADAPRMRPGLERAIAVIPLVAAPRDGAEATPRGELLRQLAAVMSERLRAALSPMEGPDRLPIVPRRRVRDVIRANLSPRSDVMRHALRGGAAVMFGFAIMLRWPAPYLHWFTITMVMTLQPYMALTLVRAAERIGGTVLGGFLAALIGVYCTTPLAIAAALFPLSVVALTVRAVSFTLFMAALTPLVVLLSEIGQPGQSSLHIAVMRGLLTAAGGLLALIACVALWPSWEPGRLRGQMRAALLAHGKFAGAVIGEALGETDAAAVDAARREAGAASNAFESSLQRVLMERGFARRAAAALEAMLTVDAALRRLAGRLSVLHLVPVDARPDAAAWRAMREWIFLVTERLSEGRADIPPRPSMPEGGAEDSPLARLARPLELAAGALARGAAEGTNSPATRPKIESAPSG